MTDHSHIEAGAGEKPPARTVAALVAAVLAASPADVRIARWRAVWPEPGPWRLIGRQESMRGGRPW